MMKTTPTSTSNQTTKVKRPREGGFCVFFSLVLWLVLFSYVFVKPKNIFYLQESS
jgi:hypothetical protein